MGWDQRIITSIDNECWNRHAFQQRITSRLGVVIFRSLETVHRCGHTIIEFAESIQFGQFTLRQSKPNIDKFHLSPEIALKAVQQLPLIDAREPLLDSFHNSTKVKWR